MKCQQCLHSDSTKLTLSNTAFRAEQSCEDQAGRKEGNWCGRIAKGPSGGSAETMLSWPCSLWQTEQAMNFFWVVLDRVFQTQLMRTTSQISLMWARTKITAIFWENICLYMHDAQVSQILWDSSDVIQSWTKFKHETWNMFCHVTLWLLINNTGGGLGT